MRREPSTDDLVVIFSGVAFDGVRRSARSMAEALAQRVSVLFVDPTSSSLESARETSLRPRVRRVSNNLFHLPSVSLPGHTRAGIRFASRLALVTSVRAAIKDITTSRPLAVLLQTPRADVLGRFNERVSVYWATDAFASGSGLMGTDHASLQKAEVEAVSRSDVVIAVSDRLALHWREHGADAVVIAHGVSVEPLSDHPAPSDLALSHPIAGVVGTLSPRLDFGLLRQVVADGMSLLLIGPASFRSDAAEFTELCSMPGVAWLGAKDYDELSAYYQHIDVGLVPYTLSEFNLDSAPLKPLDYLAAGLPVVSTSLPGVIGLESPDVALADHPAEFAAAAREVAALRDESGLIERRRSHVRGWSWEARSLKLLETIADIDH